MKWQLQEAKQRFSEVVRRARDQGPQVVTRHGHDVVVVLAVEDYERLSGKRLGFKDFLRSEPYFDDLEIERSREIAPIVDL
jgi:prevent-host-death family protein